jgi:D-alanyl-D-alanine carboxypeptidase/D-alanyl-D-alanine-endopeptidase (penicillin-binding protein 4)
MKLRCVALFVTLACAAARGDLPAELGRLLHDLPHSQVAVGACVVRLPDAQEVFSLHADNPLIPASCQKVIAAAVALDVLGPDYAFETRLGRRGGSLVLIGGGDPALGDPRLAEARGEDPLAVLRRFAAAVSASAAEAPPAEILIDDTAFEALFTHPSWEPDDLPSWYAAPVGGLNFNDNCIDITLAPAAGRQVSYEISPPNDWVQVENRCVKGGGRKPWVHRNPGSLVFELRGECDRAQQLQSVSVPDPGLFTGEVFRAVLRGQGITVAAPVRRATAGERPAEVDILAAHRTPIGDVLLRALRDSQNLFAESLIKTAVREDLLNHDAREPGSWSRAADLVGSRLAAWGGDVKGLVFVDGSGLSRDNRVTARQLVCALTRVYAHMPRAAGDRFIASMSEAGKSGTLHKRMRNQPGRVYGKTGYLEGVRSLCGFVAPEGQSSWYAFAVVFNGIPGGTKPYNDIHDQVCRLLAEP